MARTCPKCAKEASAENKFCSLCGWELAKAHYRTTINFKHLLILLTLALSVWGFSWLTQEQLAGQKPPEQSMASAQSAHPQARHKHDDPLIRKLYSELKNTPKDISKLRELSSALLRKLDESPQASGQDIMEVISILKRILEQNPSDAETLLSMANITFSSNVYDKSLEYYERYLQVRPDDQDVRAQRASILIVIGKTDEAILELTKVLAENPENYLAAAHLAVAYFRKGDMIKFATLRDQAIAAAPANAERTEIKGFLDSLPQRGLESTE